MGYIKKRTQIKTLRSGEAERQNSRHANKKLRRSKSHSLKQKDKLGLKNDIYR